MASVVFFLVRLLPGDVVTVLSAEAPQYGGANELRAELGLDQPILKQYAEFIGNAAQGDFGNSLFFKRPVSDELKRAIPITVELTTLGVLFSVLISVPLGVVTATHRNSGLDRVSRVISVVFHAMPTFWLGTLAITFLALWLKWTPPLRYTPFWQSPITNLAQFVLPALVLAIHALGLQMRLVRSQMLEVLSQDYIRTANAKGLGHGLVVRRHALRNALVPVVAIVGNQAGALLGGAVITETIFNLPGLGRVLIESVTNRDYPTIEATVLVIAIFLVTANLLTDLVYAWLDPRIRYA